MERSMWVCVYTVCACVSCMSLRLDTELISPVPQTAKFFVKSHVLALINPENVQCELDVYPHLDKDKMLPTKYVCFHQKLWLRHVTIFLLLTSVIIHKHIIRTALCVIYTENSWTNYPNSPDVCNLFRNMVWNSPGSLDTNITMKTCTCYCWIHNSAFVFNAFV